MKMTMTENKFVNALMSSDAGWTYECAKILYDYYEEQEANDGIEKEFNAHDIGCDWNVSEPLDLWNEYHWHENDEPYSIENFEAWISNQQTVVYWLDNGYDILYLSDF